MNSFHAFADAGTIQNKEWQVSEPDVRDFILTDR
jgi:hypothetical protein